MFSSKQIAFMEQQGLRMNFSRLSDDDYCRIEDVVGDLYTQEAQKHPDKTTDIILMCESILDVLA